MRASLLVLVLITALPGCFSKPKPECAFLCGEGGACPADYSCAPDGWCKRSDVSADFACGDLPADATPPADAGIDAEPADADLSVDAGRAMGEDCTDGNQCDSGNCSDGKCCDTACNGECNACSAAAGASADGTCTLLGGSVECRPATGPCDIAESCTGSAAACPADDVENLGVQCDAANDGDCDAVDECNGTDKTCPETVQAQGSLGSPNDCGGYVCDGTSPVCPTTCDGNEDCDGVAGFTCSAPSCTM